MIEGQHSAPERVLVHLTDTHLLANSALLAGTVDTQANLRAAAARIPIAAPDADAIVVSGDIADLGESGAYAFARAILEPVADELQAQLVWAAGNHDERGAMRQALELTGVPDAPIDAVLDLGELRIVTLDTSLANWHHGGFDDGQAEWLEAALANPPGLGSVLVMHHPPLPYRAPLMRYIDFKDEERLAEIVTGENVRAILSGHLHVEGSGSFHGIPVFLAGATSYVDDLAAPMLSLRGIDAEQSFSVIEIFTDRVTQSLVPAAQHPYRESIPESVGVELSEVPFAEAAERFSRKSP